MYLGELVCRAGLRLGERPVLIMLLPPGKLSRAAPGDDGRRFAGASGSSFAFSPLASPEHVPPENVDVLFRRTRSRMLKRSLSFCF